MQDAIVSQPYMFEEFDAFDNHILKHIIIEYAGKNDFLKYCILERYSVYDGLQELAAILTDEIHIIVNNKLKIRNYSDFSIVKTKESLNKVPNIFFSRLNVHCIFAKQTVANYHRTLDAKLTDDWLVELNVYINPSDRNWPNVIYKKLMHKLTHAYDDYNALLKNNRRFDLAYSLMSDIKNFDAQNRILVNSDNREYFKEVFKFILNIERNAYIAELVEELKQLDDRNAYKPQDIVKILKKSEIYNIYKAILYNIEKYKTGHLSQDIIQDFTVLYNEANHSKLSSNKVFKKLENLAKEFIKKFDETIGKVCLESISLSNSIVEDSTSMIDSIKQFIF